MRDLDSVSGELLVLTLFEEDQPPLGLTGLVDWRLDGLISRLRATTLHPDHDNPYYRGLVLGRFHARAGEKLLFPAHSRVPFFHVMVFGLGTKKEYNGQRYREAVREILRSVSLLGTKQMTLQLPGWTVAGLPARRACEVFMSELQALKNQGINVPRSVCFVEDVEYQAEMDEKIREVNN